MRFSAHAIAAAVAIAWIGAIAQVSTRGPQQSPPPAGSPPSSVLDGAYTAAQAKRGEAVYKDQCARCHGKALEGNTEGAVPLAGPEFMAGRGRSTVGAFFNRIRTSMPDDDPGTVSAEDVADVIAYILSVNKYPEGSVELPHEAERLKNIRFDAIKK